ncbi:MAG: hypothetical protein EXR07_17260 [Acetobacteraceae bacterium]|nr:hypothetical protein [Acetobacteraceae bacterium]
MIAQFAAGTALLSKLPSNAVFAVSGVTAQAVAAMQGNARVVSFGVTDTAGNVAAVLVSLSASTKLTTIALTDAAPLTVTLAQIAAYGAVFARLPSNYGLNVSGVNAAAAATIQNNTHVRSFSVTDSSVNIAAWLNALNGYTRLVAIILTDSKALSISFAQYSNDALALSKIGTAWQTDVEGVTAVAAAGAQGNIHVASFSVADSSAAVASNLDALNGDGKLSRIHLTGSPVLALSARQLTSDTAALGKIVAGYQVTIAGALVAELTSIHGNSHVTSIQITDTAANIAAALGILSSDSLVTSIALTGGSTLTIGYNQLVAHGAALGKLAIQAQLAVIGVSAANARSLQNNPRVSSFSVSDTAANIAANLDALSAGGKLSSIGISGPAALTLGYDRFVAGTPALDKVVGAYTVTVTGTPAAGATLVAANAHVIRFDVSDTIGGIGAKLDQLEAAVKTGKLTSIQVTDTGGSLTISGAQYAADADAIALIHGAFTIYQAAATGGAKINLIWDARALAAPAAFRAAITYAAQYIQSLIVNPITVNIAVGYGEVAGSPLGNGVLGAAGPDRGIGRTYAQFKNDLATHVSSSISQTVVNNLPVADPSNGGTIYLASAQAKALGLMAGAGSALDGSMGFAADPNGTLFTYDPNNRAAAGKYDLIGVAEHELTHALGRIALGGTYGKWISALDVFRYSAPGVHSPNAGGNAYFSIDGGATNLNPFASSSDLADWSSAAGNDANNAFSKAGVVNAMTPADIFELNALGFATSGTPPASTAVQTTVSAPGGLNARALSFLGSPMLAFMNDEAPIFDTNLNPETGIEIIALFEYGVNELRIDLQGADPSAFLVFDTIVEGSHAIALANKADISHGLVLTGMTADATAADLMANHLSFSGGHAIVA